jgi:hypothetical protein
VSERPDAGVLAALAGAALVALGVAWWATNQRHEREAAEGAAGVADTTTPPTQGAAPADPATGAGAGGGPDPNEPNATWDGAVGDAMLGFVEDEQEPGSAVPGGEAARPPPRELGVRPTAHAGRDSPVRALVAGERAKPLPAEVGPPPRATTGPIRTPPGPDPLPVLRQPVR